jgi:hypothetical protein
MNELLVYTYRDVLFKIKTLITIGLANSIVEHLYSNRVIDTVKYIESLEQ